MITVGGQIKDDFNGFTYFLINVTQEQKTLNSTLNHVKNPKFE